jgi:hypothetical protein
MSLLAAEESANIALISNVKAQLPPAPDTVPTAVVPPPNLLPNAAVGALAAAFPALTTKVKLNSILKKK